MPTVKNITDNTINVYDMNDRLVPLGPNKQMESSRFPADEEVLELISDTPYYNRVISNDAVVLSESYADVTVDLDTDILVCIGSTGTITVFAQDETNTPPELNDYPSESPVVIIEAKGRMNKLRVKGSGTWHVIQYRK